MCNLLLLLMCIPDCVKPSSFHMLISVKTVKRVQNVFVLKDRQPPKLPVPVMIAAFTAQRAPDTYEFLSYFLMYTFGC